MASIHLTRQHSAGLAVARAEVARIARRAQQEHGARCVWDGDILRFSHPGAAGHVAVGADTVALHIRLSFLLAPMKAQIEALLADKIDRALARHGAAVG